MKQRYNAMIKTHILLMLFGGLEFVVWTRPEKDTRIIFQGLKQPDLGNSRN